MSTDHEEANSARPVLRPTPWGKPMRPKGRRSRRKWPPRPSPAGGRGGSVTGPAIEGGSRRSPAARAIGRPPRGDPGRLSEIESAGTAAAGDQVRPWWRSRLVAFAAAAACLAAIALPIAVVDELLRTQDAPREVARQTSPPARRPHPRGQRGDETDGAPTDLPDSRSIKSTSRVVRSWMSIPRLSGLPRPCRRGILATTVPSLSTPAKRPADMRPPPRGVSPG